MTTQKTTISERCSCQLTRKIQNINDFLINIRNWQRIATLNIEEFIYKYEDLFGKQSVVSEQIGDSVFWISKPFLMFTKEKLNTIVLDKKTGMKRKKDGFRSEIYNDNKIQVIYRFGNFQFLFLNDNKEMENDIYYEMTKDSFLTFHNLSLKTKYNFTNVLDIKLKERLLIHITNFKLENFNTPAIMRA